MAVRHLGELKKKNPMEPELKSRFTNPPTLSAYISPKPQRPGHPQTYAKSLRGSGGRAAAASHSPRRGRRAVHGAPAARPPERSRRTPARAPSAPARPLQPPFHPGTCKANLRAYRRPEKAARGRKKAAPPPHQPVRPLPPPHGQALGTPGAAEAVRAPGRRPRRVSSAPGERASPGPGLPARPAAASSGPAAYHTCRRGPPCPHSRPAPLGSGDGNGNPDRRRSSP